MSSLSLIHYRSQHVFRDMAIVSSLHFAAIVAHSKLTKGLYKPADQQTCIRDSFYSSLLLRELEAEMKRQMNRQTLCWSHIPQRQLGIFGILNLKFLGRPVGLVGTVGA